MAEPEKIQLPAVSKFLDHPGEPTISIEDWMSIFDQFLTINDANRTTALTSSQKNALLFLYLGREGSRILKSNPIYASISTETWKRFREATIAQFAKEKSVVRAPEPKTRPR